jgi:hypothetical protein
MVMRPGFWGNYVSRPAEKTLEAHAQAVAEFRAWCYRPEQAAYRERARPELRGFDLACSCPQGWPCHGDVLLEIANAEEPAS